MLHINELTYRIEGRTLLDQASAGLPDRARIGLVGRNGVGKSTLLRIITGELTPDGGAIQLPSRWRVGAIAQEAPGGPESLLETVLAAADSSMTYRSRYQSSVQLPRVVDLLLVDETNPRSVGFQLAGLEERLRSLHHAPHEDLHQLLALVRQTPLDELVELETGSGRDPRRTGLERVLADLDRGLPALDDALNLAYFSHARQHRQGPGFRRGDES